MINYQLKIDNQFDNAMHILLILYNLTYGHVEDVHSPA
jgi:hypothetical protein